MDNKHSTLLLPPVVVAESNIIMHSSVAALPPLLVWFPPSPPVLKWSLAAVASCLKLNTLFYIRLYHITLCNKVSCFLNIASLCSKGGWNRKSICNFNKCLFFLLFASWKQVRYQVYLMKGVLSRAWCVRMLRECRVTGFVLMSCTILHSGHTAASHDLFSEPCSPSVSIVLPFQLYLLFHILPAF